MRTDWYHGLRVTIDPPTSPALKLLLVAACLLWIVTAHAATPQDATVQYVAPVVDATHSAASSCVLDRAGVSLGPVTPGQVVTAAAPDYGGPYTYNLTCSNSGGSAAKVTLIVNIPAVVLPPNPPTNFTLTFKCSTVQGSTQPTCVQS